VVALGMVLIVSHSNLWLYYLCYLNWWYSWPSDHV